jgi:hypothetical protein
MITWGIRTNFTDGEAKMNAMWSVTVRETFGSGVPSILPAGLHFALR